MKMNEDELLRADYISAIERALAKLRHSARQARERAAALCDETTATLFARLASAIVRQIWFLHSPSSGSGERRRSQATFGELAVRIEGSRDLPFFNYELFFWACETCAFAASLA